MTDVWGPGTRPTVLSYLERLYPRTQYCRDDRHARVRFTHSRPAHAGGQAGRSDLALAGLVCRASSGQMLPALEGPAEVAETGHEGHERIEDDAQRR
jgi:hypothetical protein